MNRYEWRLNGNAICDLGVDSMTLSLRAGGPDTLSWAYPFASTTPPFAIHNAVVVTCVTINEDEEVIASETMFSGRVNNRPVQNRASGSGWSFTAENAWADIKRVILTQPWNSYNPTTQSLQTIEVPRVVLGLGESGDYRHTGQIITEIVAKAASRGANIASGNIAPSLAIPPVEVVDTTCDAALRQVLRYHPDHIAWIEDGNRLWVRPPAALPTFTIDPCDEGFDYTHNPQTDEIPGGVVIVWEQTHDVDGVQKIQRIPQTAGPISGWPPPLYMTIPLAGTSVTTKFERIESRTLPVAGSTSAPVAKRFFKGLIPQLADAADEDLLISSYEVVFADSALDEIDDPDTETVNPNSATIDRGNDDPEDFPRMLVSGQVQPWFPDDIKQYDAVIKARIRYKGSNAEVRAFMGSSLEVTEPITITNALPKIYRATDSVTAAQQPIQGLATAYWNAISNARDEGSLIGYIGNSFRDLRPGRKVILSGVFATAAPITESTFDLIQNTFSLRYGSSEYLNPKTIADLAKAMARNAPTWRTPEERTEASAAANAAGPIREGSNGNTRTATPTQTPARFPWDLVPAASGTEGEWDLIKGDIWIPNGGVFVGGGEQFHIQLTGGTGLELSAGQVIYIETSNPLPGTGEIKVDTGWSNYPAFYEFSDPDGDGNVDFEHYRFPLWQILSTPGDDGRGVKLADGIYGRKLCFTDLILSFGVYEQRAVNGDSIVPPTGAQFFASAPAGLLLDP